MPYKSRAYSGAPSDVKTDEQLSTLAGGGQAVPTECQNDQSFSNSKKAQRLIKKIHQKFPQYEKKSAWGGVCRAGGGWVPRLLGPLAVFLQNPEQKVTKHNLATSVRPASVRPASGRPAAFTSGRPTQTAST